MPFAVQIVTAKNATPMRCVPVFASREEARRYGQYLRRQEEMTIKSWDSIEMPYATPNATFAKGTRRFKWGCFANDEA